MKLHVFTFYCSHCGAVVEATPTNTNSRLNMTCRGQEPDGPPGTPLTGNHPAEQMRQIGSKPL